jgi:hypothetical protein
MSRASNHSCHDRLMRIACLVLAGCHALPPPPVIAPHAGVEMDREGATTAVVVIGFAGELLGGGGIGVALRVENQTTERTVLGVELTGGLGDLVSGEDGENFNQNLIAIRGYGRSVVFDRARDLLATYGAGLAAMTSGLLAASVHAGVVAGYPNQYLEPVAAVGVALAVPLVAGAPYGAAISEHPQVSPPPPRHHTDFPIFAFNNAPTKPTLATPVTDVFLAVDVGVVVPVASTGNRVSVDLGLGDALMSDQEIIETSLADGQRN